MKINRAAIGALAVFGVVAAGSGACSANRQADPKPSADRVLNAPTVAGSVNETENNIAPAPAPAPATPVPIPAKPTAAVPTVNTRHETAAPRTSRAPASVPAPAQRSRPAIESPAHGSSAPRASIDPPVSAAIEPVENTTVERAPYVPPVPQKQFEDLVLPADSVIGLQIDNAISSDRAKVEDAVRARVSRDVKVRDHVAIPAGARAEGSITLVDRGGRLKDQARLGIRFHTIVLADGTRLPITTETIYREGDSPAKESAAKIGGGAVGGAVLGAILGGKKGAIIGSTVGAGAGGAAVAASEPNVATLAAGSTVTVRMSAPATVTVEK